MPGAGAKARKKLREWCATSRSRFPTRVRAELYLDRSRTRRDRARWRAYPCPECGDWHITANESLLAAAGVLGPLGAGVRADAP